MSCFSICDSLYLLKIALETLGKQDFVHFPMKLLALATIGDAILDWMDHWHDPVK